MAMITYLLAIEMQYGFYIYIIYIDEIEDRYVLNWFASSI